MDEWKRSGQIPAFGNWEMANEMPITQYFECARQAGLVRYSSSSTETHSHPSDLYSLDFNNKPPPPPPIRKKGNRNRGERRCVQVHVNELVVNGNGKIMRKHGKVWDVTQHHHHQPEAEAEPKSKHQNDAVPPHQRRPSNAKPVDEDLYKIPPELLRTTKRKKMLGFISKCLVPAACVS